MNRALKAGSGAPWDKLRHTYVTGAPDMTSTSMTFEEGFQMSERSAPAPSSKSGEWDGLVSVLKNVALVVTIIGAVPTAITAYHAWTFGVPFSQVPQRLAQYDLWVKNIDCSIEYKALATAEGTRVDVGACPKTGDIALKLSAPDGKAAYQWIAYNELQKPGEQPRSSSFIDLLISAARAETPPKSFKMAQAMEVMCQSIQGKNVVRIVKEGGKCYREVFSPIRGAVESREETPCTTKCG
jgi:hypothetical protein